MDAKVFFAIYGIMCLAQEVSMELDVSMEYSNIVRQVNIHSSIINNLQRRLDKLLEEQNMQGEVVHRNQNRGKASCKCKPGPQGAPGPAGPRGVPGPEGPPGALDISGDDDTCLVVVGKCPTGLVSNVGYEKMLQPLPEIPLNVCCKSAI